MQIVPFHPPSLNERYCSGPQVFLIHQDSYHQLPFLQNPYPTVLAATCWLVNTDLYPKWHTITTNITQATSLPFSHKYNAAIPTPEDVSTTLHVFADASPKAFGAAAYIQQDQNPASLVMSKSRTAPLKLYLQQN